MRSRPTPIGAVVRGLLAGAAGTAVMTAAQSAYLKARCSEPSTTPAEVGRRIVEGVLQREVPEQRMDQLNRAMHWLYGTSWGALYGLVEASRRSRRARDAALFGTAVWAASLVHLPAMQLAPPVWEYSPEQLAPGVGFHLVYGVGVGAAYAMLDRG